MCPHTTERLQFSPPLKVIQKENKKKEKQLSLIPQDRLGYMDQKMPLDSEETDFFFKVVYGLDPVQIMDII